MKTEISIDKVSITGKLIAAIDKTSMFDFLSAAANGVEYYYTAKNFMYQHNFKLPDGSFFQYGVNQGEENARLEWNPNKSDNRMITKIIERLKYPKVTRIDWACDYYDIDMKDFEFRDLVGRSEREYKSRSKKRETLYIGSPSSDNFIRIYNKELEMRKGKNKSEDEIDLKRMHWRVEAVQKDFTAIVEKEMESIIEIDGKQSKLLKKEKVKTDGYLFDNPFKVIEVYEKMELGSEGLKMQEKAMLFYLQHNPEEWTNLSPNSRKKYEELKFAMGAALIEVQPRQVFEKEKSRLAHDLYSWLKPAIDNGRYLVGHITNIEYSMMFLKNQLGEEYELSPVRVDNTKMAMNDEELEKWIEAKKDILGE